jgi:ABC-type uncharacterized transport system permease subunit
MKTFLNKHVVPTLWYVGVGLLIVLFILSAVKQSKTESTSDVFYGLLSENNLRMTGGIVCEDSRCDFDVQWSLVEGTR